MNGIGKELIRWLLGGGAVALAAFLGTTAYQQGQLNIERERHLRDFLGRYVELATKGTLDERIRFVQYWESLDVSDQIGVDLTRYKEALATEFNKADNFASQMVEAKPQPPAPAPEQQPVPPTPAPVVETTPPEPKPTPPVVISPPKEQFQQRAAPQAITQQEAYFASRSQTIAKLIPGASEAPNLEWKGFAALLDGDLRAANDAFRAAEKAWPEYHNVAELARATGKLLQPGQPGEDGILGPVALKRLYEVVLRDYSWGMPAALKARMQAAVKD